MDPNKEITIAYKPMKKGFQVRIDSKKFNVLYPDGVWDKFPKNIKQHVAENFIYLATCSLAAVIKKDSICYDMNSPLLKSSFLVPNLQYLPTCAGEYNKDYMFLAKRFLNTQYRFKSHHHNGLNYIPKVDERSVHLFTFGKDSMLGYAVAEEMGLKPVGVYIEEPDIRYLEPTTQKIENIYENQHKELLIRRFKSEFNRTIYRINNQLGLIRYSDFYNLIEPELCWGSQLTEYAFLILPFNHFFKARYLVYGNEASCNGLYYNNEGLLINPVFDQCSEWTVEISKFLKILTRKVSAVSFVEPLHEIAITRILHRRYPHYAKYQMSCFADSNNAQHSRWCHSCSKCARNFSFLAANGIDPKSVGFKESMFKESKKHLFSLFGSKKTMRLYDASGLGRDEMMLAFYMAYQNGAKGHLIRLFEKRFLEEAERRKEELYRTYFSIQDSITLPQHIKRKILDIYKGELEGVPEQYLK